MEYFYPAIVKHNAKGGIFSVIFPDLNGCQAQGRTAEEAVLKAREALAASLLEMEEKGLEIPPASDERLFRLRYGGSRCCTILVNMETYREYREYKVRAADHQTAVWAETARKTRRVGILARVFGLR